MENNGENCYHSRGTQSSKIFATTEIKKSVILADCSII